MIGSQRTHFDVRHHMHLHALLKDYPMRVFQVASPNLGAIDDVGRTKSLTRCNLSFQHVTPIVASFLKILINALYRCDPPNPTLTIGLKIPCTFWAYSANSFFALVLFLWTHDVLDHPADGSFKILVFTKSNRLHTFIFRISLI